MIGGDTVCAPGDGSVDFSSGRRRPEAVLQPFVVGLLSRDGSDRGDHIIQAEVHRLDAELPGFYFRKIESNLQDTK